MRTFPGPYWTVACCGIPSRKSAKSSAPPRIVDNQPDEYKPVNTNAPRALLSVWLFDSSNRKSPPRCIVCFVPAGLVSPYASEKRLSVRRDGVRSLTPENVENDNCGTPQSNGSVATPVIPALPATSST